MNKANPYAQKHVKARKHARTRKQLIPKPKGSAGKSAPKGYNLQDAMGLTENKRRYNELAVRS